MVGFYKDGSVVWREGLLIYIGEADSSCIWRQREGGGGRWGSRSSERRVSWETRAEAAGFFIMGKKGMVLLFDMVYVVMVVSI